ncbi:MAG: glycosyltransferase [Corynebacterium kroppenstedtii]|uniref:Glycosyltransferase n=1 Tax=Corynebacterium kroppenstedtii TaxID=161879 RepID=A0A2W5SMX5_9CORY|nr:glycosyltransferase [Corynebacterium kroppenstedtii]MDU7286823.1 glycosyltransferase [Corynebacterium kroppenstedtii]PZR03900.1 MAG: glycosyltransferase [Corynebacterium kroppenstedtii]
MQQVSYFLGQVVSFFLTLARLIPLRVHNEFDGKPIPQSGPVTISVTTHGPRMDKVWYTLESLARGTLSAPIVLWLDKEDYERPLPDRLQRLVDRGLQIRCSDGSFGPHTKYWPLFRERVASARERVAHDPDSAASARDSEIPDLASEDLLTLRVATADDDIIYPEWWLERLLECADVSPHDVIAYRAHRVCVKKGALAPYARWPAVKSCRASIANMATGVSGVLYPLPLMAFVVDQGDSFRRLAPKADDIWLHACAVRSGTKVRQVFGQQRNFAVVPTTQFNAALVVRNVWMGGNDVQASRVYTDADIAALKQASAL